MAAFTWAFALVLFKKSGERVPPLALNLFKGVAAIGMFVLTIITAAALATLGHAVNLPWLASLDWLAAANPLGVLTGDEWLRLTLSAVIGIAVADTLFFAALNRIGVGIMVVVECLYSPSTLAFAWLLLGEHPRLAHYIGGGLILLGIALSTRHDPPPGRSRTDLAIGIFYGAAAMITLAFGIVIAKPVIADHDVIWITLIRLILGTLALLGAAGLSPRRRQFMHALRPNASWLHSLPASFFGNYLALTFWIAGFKYTHASVAAILNQTSVIFAVALAALFLNERLTRRKFNSIALAAAGALVVLAAPAIDTWLRR